MASQVLAPPASAARNAVWRVALLIALSVVLNRFVIAFYAEKLSFLYLRELHLNASTVATLGIITGIPAYLRPFMGAASDLFPLFGFHRRSYYALSWLVYALGLGSLGLVGRYHVPTVVGLIIVAAAGANLLFVVMDAVMVGIGNVTGSIGRLQTVQQFLQPVLGLFVSHLGGYVTQHYSYHTDFLAAAAIALLGMPLALLIDERRVGGAAHAAPGVEEREAQEAARRTDHERTQAALRQAAKSPGLWAIVGFVFYLIITPGTNTAQFYYQVKALHFSPQFIGDLGIYGSAGAILGILAYAAFSPRLPIRAVVACAWLMDCAIYLTLMGLHDRSSAMVVTFIGAVIGGLYNLSLLTIAARACPPGIEGTVYGLVIAATGLGGTLGEKIGASLYDYFGPAHHYSTPHGWFSLLWIGFGFTVLAAVFFPFLPAWAKSRTPLGARAADMETEPMPSEPGVWPPPPGVAPEND